MLALHILAILLCCSFAATRSQLTAKRYLGFMDCDPPKQRNWTSFCFQEDVVPSPPDGPAGPGLNSTCSASSTGGNKDWLRCAGERLVTVHRRWGMPGMLSLEDMWSKSGCFYWNCTASALAPDWDTWLGGQLAALKPAFYNGSIIGVSLGDELASDGVPCENISAVASFIKQQLNGSGVFVMINDGSTAFGCLPGACEFKRDYAGSWVDYGRFPAAVDYVGFDLYTGQLCFKNAAGGGGKCGYEMNPVDCILRECEAQTVIPWVVEQVFPLLAPHQSVWVIPGSFGANASVFPAAGNMTHQEDMLLLQLRMYWEWMQHEPRISGIFPWHWYYRDMHDAYSLGTVQFPRLVEAYKAIGMSLNKR